MKPVVVILGPTATGKSGLALRLAESLGGEIVNADALQIYRQFDIGTAKPTPQDRARVRHHLVDVLDPGESFSAGEFARRARRALDEIKERDRLAFLVGGSGFYLQALLEGLSPVPPIPASIRAKLKARLTSEGLEALRRELEQVDPESAQRLAPGDTQRVLRSLEVWSATGRTLSSWRDEGSVGGGFVTSKIGLTLARGLLYDRIAERVRAMLQAGWIQEVQQLLDSGLDGSEPAFQAIGYRELLEHVRDGKSLEEITTEITASTRRYAKRQLTWFRRDAEITWFVASDADALERSVRAKLREDLRRGGQE